MRLKQYKNKTVLSLPGKRKGTFPERAAFRSSQDMNVHFCTPSRKAPQAQQTSKRLVEDCENIE